MRSYFLLLVSAVLAFFSLLTLKSVAPDLVGRQALFFILGTIGFIIASKLTIPTWQQLGRLGYVVITALLLFLLIVGTTTRGISGWIELPFGFKLQPSQFAILTTTLLLIKFKPQIKLDLVEFAKKLLLLGLPGLLILLEPDLGTALVYFLSVGILVFFWPVPRQYLTSMFIVGCLVLILGWQFGLRPYQKQRLTSFLAGYEQIQGDSELSNATYNARQSLIAVGSGQWLGRGLGQGVQSHLRFLPERQTDFIFASLAEELGFLGASLVMVLYLLQIWFLLRVAHRPSQDPLSLYLLVVAMMIGVQAGINMGMNMGLLPITGITLPLLSYGGSSVMAVLIMLGLAQGYINQQGKAKVRRFA